MFLKHGSEPLPPANPGKFSKLFAEVKTLFSVYKSSLL